MPAAKDILSATSAASEGVFGTFEQHCNGLRIDTKTTALCRIKGYYPDYHVTEASEYRVALFDYATANKAELTLDSASESFNATRRWSSVGERIEKKLHPGKLDDDYRFARFQYIWEGHEFLVYFIAWKDMLDSPQRMFYILYPRATDSSNIVDGHCAETDALMLAAGKWTAQLHEEIWVFDDSRWEKSKDLWKAVNGSSWSDVILDPEMKKNLIEDVQGFFDNAAVYSDFAVPWKRGIILHGVPGNGKTVSIKALMSSLYDREDKIPSLYVKSFDDKCKGEQYSIRQIFTQARSCAPCLLIFEDLDSLVGDDVRSYFLNEVDGLESNDGILMIGSTNHLDKLDPAIAKRPSRFDRKYHFKIPGTEERTAYADYWRKKLIKNNTVPFAEELCPIIAHLTEGFSFAYMKELFVMALLSLVRGFKGDDFEIVDAEEAEKAKEDEAAAAGASASEEKTSADETCACAKICNKCSKPLPASADNNSCSVEDVEDEKKEDAKKNRMVMPTVDIPDHLADNLLLKVIKHQIRILHSEMDNTKEDEWPSGKMGIGGTGGQYQAMMAMMRRRRC
ncbi:P-loop containing nucleoside triphosphate hydrolase protein [Melanomma pulvis-pyrius CBS 109.77]|uniref:P-loop containing nucleoside triphosphate hydrolase protein n=1 Tax=Melanomma pulvis-pyrius CBS 109.77 TaxID=1314802 RepID=A0A6A6WQF3_9PLEO|nr:P-loop containing nucleoside triphosphate hydrolase protein [Melanomma pulvis-pyrius CBS 109.77]